MIEIENITKTFKKYSKYPIKALNNASCTIGHNKVYGLIGANGAGKTTLIRIILGFEQQDSGTISINHKSNLLIDTKKLIGYQSDLPYISKSVKLIDYLKMNSALAGYNNNDSQIDEYLVKFKLTGSYTKSLAELSKGMRQKAEIVSAFIGQPQIVILDEPTAALDPIATLELREFINSKRNTGITILFSSHHLSEVEHICDNVLLIDSGQIHKEFEMANIEKGALEEEFRKFITEQN